MTSVVLSGATSGSGTITVPDVAGTFTATMGSATGTHYPFSSGTAVASTSGTSIDFTSIPSWVKRITVMFNGVSTSGTNPVQIQLGSGSVQTTGYASTQTSGGGTTNASTSGLVCGGTLAADTRSGIATICLLSASTFSWVHSGTVKSSTTNNFQFGGDVTLSGTLDRIRITTVGGTDTFDAGSINILYE